MQRGITEETRDSGMGFSTLPGMKTCQRENLWEAVALGCYFLWGIQIFT